MPGPTLLVVDVQERLFTAMDAERRDEMLRNAKTLAIAARRLGVPIVATEQYPKGLGPTLPELRELLEDAITFEKVTFSCCGADGFLDQLRAADSTHVILVGLETHVCVLLTAVELLQLGFRVTVVADAVCSRARANHEIGLGEARQAGAVISTTETVVFQLLGRADTDVFREVSKLLR